MNEQRNTLSDIFLKVFLYIYVILMPIGTGLAGIIGNFSLINLFSAGIVLAGVTNALITKELVFERGAIATIFYFLFTVVSFVWSVNRVINWYTITNCVNFLVLFFLLNHEWRKADFDKISYSLILSQIIVLIAVIVNINTIFSYRLNITIVSTMGISDFACGLCLMLALWMDKCAGSQNLLLRVISYAFIIIDIVIVILAGSRGALAMVFAMIVAWVVLAKYRISSKIVIITLVLITGFIIIKYLIYYLPDTILSRLSFEAIERTEGSGRFTIWRTAWEVYKKSNFIRKLVGYGFNSFQQKVGYFSNHVYMGHMAHNVATQTLIEGGIIGELLLLTMIYSQLKAAVLNRDGLMLIALVGLFVAALSNDMQVTRIWGFILSYNCMRNSGVVSK